MTTRIPSFCALLHKRYSHFLQNSERSPDSSGFGFRALCKIGSDSESQKVFSELSVRYVVGTESRRFRVNDYQGEGSGYRETKVPV